MAGFNFEKNLKHQTQAVDSIISVFEGLNIQKPKGLEKQFQNPMIKMHSEYISDRYYAKNIRLIREENRVSEGRINRNKNIIDIMMETGTGKTYTYTKAIFELNKKFGLFKFVIIVPTLPIKAGTIDFLKSDSSRDHFKEQYGKTIKLHIVESKKGKKNSKSNMPPAVDSFAREENTNKNNIHVLVVNAGMINSDTMHTSVDRTLFDKYSIPIDAISSSKPFLIIDEPHRFSQSNKTWQNIKKIKAQYILRFGATFREFENLIYNLTAVDSFSRNLVKGVIGHITKFEAGENSIIKFINSDGKEASIELTENGVRKSFKISKKESFEKIHSAMTDLKVENLNKSTLLLSNGLELKKGDKINPFSYAETLQESMIKKAVSNHFQLERKLLTRDVKIKPLSLFFIDNIEEYREKDGYLKILLEKYIIAESKKLLATEKNEFYRKYLESTIDNVAITHGGYFSKDNSDKDELIEKEVEEILHDKQSMLNLENPRRFILSKWTLREGWDNPNVFQICKLRSSGSEISKLQEVGRGLRLPVNEFGNRVKNEQFHLNYFVDFTENDFVDKLVNEVNQSSNAISPDIIPEILTNVMIKIICEKYGFEEDELLEKLDEENVISRSNKFKDGGFEYIRTNFPEIFTGVGSDKIRKAESEKKKVKIRTEKYPELKSLWEKLNEKVVLEYKIKNENEFRNIFTEFLKVNKNNFYQGKIIESQQQLEIDDNKAIVKESSSASDNKSSKLAIINYDEFLMQLSKVLNINIKTLHASLVESGINFNDYLNPTSIRIIKQMFDEYLMYNAIDKFEIEYQKVTNTVHPTKFTDDNGELSSEIYSSDIGIFSTKEKVADTYFFDELFYDSELEKENIKSNINEVVVFTKIPKNSIKIPISGGKSYSPDFAYVLDFKDGRKKLNFIVETKDTDEKSLRKEESQKIKHAEKFFGNEVNIKFKTQFSKNKMIELIKETFG